MTTPVVNIPPTPEQPPKKKQKPTSLVPSAPDGPSPTPSNLQRKKQHRHSGIRVADLGPGTMPRGKYPESPAPAGSHALISRTPTPGGMLHANLGLPRPPPRNFQLSRGQHTPDTGATPKEKTKTNLPRAISPERVKEPPAAKIIIVIPEFSFRASGRKISGISAARRA